MCRVVIDNILIMIFFVVLRGELVRLEFLILFLEEFMDLFSVLFEYMIDVYFDYLCG